MTGSRRVVGRACVGALTAALVVGSSGVAFAQRYGDTQFPKPASGGETRRFPAVAYDGAHDAYLVAWGVIQIGARFVSSEGIPLGAPVPLNTDGASRQAGAARAACGANINACLITWVEETPSRIVGRLVRNNGGNLEFLSDRFPISETGAAKLSSSAPSVAYSPVASEFLVSWTETNSNVYAQRVSASGAPVGAVIPVAITGAWEGLPCVTYNSVADEFFIAFYFEPNVDAVGGARIKPGTGEVLSHNPASGNMLLYAGVFEKYPEVVYNSAANEYLAITWGSGFTVHGQRLTAGGQPIGGVLTLAVGGGDGIGVGYSAGANSYLATYQHPDVGEAWASLIASDGTPGPRFQGTFSGGATARQPQAAGSSQAPRFLMVSTYLYAAVMSQVVATGGSPTPPPPPPTPCSGSLSSSSASFNYLGGGGSVTLTIGSACEWTGSSSASWLTLTGGSTSGTGGRTITFSVEANASSGARNATFTIAGQTYTVSQTGVPCSYSITPGSVSISSPAADGTAFVSTGPSCGWSASSASSFLTFGASSGTGPGGVGFVIEQNYSTNPRTITGTIAGQSFSASQSGAPLHAGLRSLERKHADFNGDGFSDILWQDTVNGYLALWALAGNHTDRTPMALSHSVADPDWRMVATGDFNQDGKPDIVWHHRGTGMLYLWYMDGVNRIGHSAFSVGGISDTRWHIVGSGDFNQDGKPDLAWQHDTGWLAVWFMDNTTLIGGVDTTPIRVDPMWKIVGVADLNADGKSDFVWRNFVTGDLGVWLMDGAVRLQYLPLSPQVVDDLNWQVAAIIDVNGDQTPDLVWRHIGQGWVAVWYMNGTHRIDAGSFPIAIDTNWKIAGPK